MQQKKASGGTVMALSMVRCPLSDPDGQDDQDAAVTLFTLRAESPAPAHLTSESRQEESEESIPRPVAAGGEGARADLPLSPGCSVDPLSLIRRYTLQRDVHLACHGARDDCHWHCKLHTQNGAALSPVYLLVFVQLKYKPATVIRR